MDPAYAGWFLRFSGDNNYHVPTCDNNWSPPRCSAFYHDQDQTPEHPHGDGSCVNACDCGEGVPCGEYLQVHARARGSVRAQRGALAAPAFLTPRLLSHHAGGITLMVLCFPTPRLVRSAPC